MFCDTNWCTFCDNAINPYSDSLYCSEECLRQDALNHHPMLGYDYSDLKNFPHASSSQQKKKENDQDTVLLPNLVRKMSSIPSKAIPSLSPSLSSSVSSYASSSSSSHEDPAFMPTSYFHPKPQRIASSIPLIERLNQAIIGL